MCEKALPPFKITPNKVNYNFDQSNYLYAYISAVNVYRRTGKATYICCVVAPREPAIHIFVSTSSGPYLVLSKVDDIPPVFKDVDIDNPITKTTALKMYFDITSHWQVVEDVLLEYAEANLIS